MCIYSCKRTIGLLRDCENFADGSFAALIVNIQILRIYCGGHTAHTAHLAGVPLLLLLPLPLLLSEHVAVPAEDTINVLLAAIPMSYLLLLNMSLSPLSRSLSWLNTAAVTALRSLLDPGPYTPAAVPRPGGGYIFISIYTYVYTVSPAGLEVPPTRAQVG